MNFTYIPTLSESENIDILGFIVSPFTGILGDYFWLVLGLLIVGMLFLKSQDVALPTILGLIFTAAFGVYLPQSMGVALLMLLGTGIGAILYKVFKTEA